MVTINFKNPAESKPVSVYWLDYSKKEVKYFSLRPGQSIKQQTYPGHQWIVRDTETNRLIMKFTALKNDSAVDIPKIESVKLIPNLPQKPVAKEGYILDKNICRNAHNLHTWEGA